MLQSTSNIREKLEKIYHTDIQSDDRITKDEFAGEFALKYVRQLLAKRQSYRKPKKSKD